MRLFGFDEITARVSVENRLQMRGSEEQRKRRGQMRRRGRKRRRRKRKRMMGR